MYCKKCGQKIEKNLKYCSKCSSVLNEIDIIIKKNKKVYSEDDKILIGIYSFFSLIGLIGLIICFFKKDYSLMFKFYMIFLISTVFGKSKFDDNIIIRILFILLIITHVVADLFPIIYLFLAPYFN